MERHQTIGYTDKEGDHFYCPEPGCDYQIHFYVDDRVKVIGAKPDVNHYGLIAPNDIDLNLEMDWGL